MDGQLLELVTVIVYTFTRTSGMKGVGSGMAPKDVVTFQMMSEAQKLNAFRDFMASCSCEQCWEEREYRAALVEQLESR